MQSITTFIVFWKCSHTLSQRVKWPPVWNFRCVACQVPSPSSLIAADGFNMPSEVWRKTKEKKEFPKRSAACKYGCWVAASPTGSSPFWSALMRPAEWWACHHCRRRRAQVHPTGETWQSEEGCGFSDNERYWPPVSSIWAKKEHRSKFCALGAIEVDWVANFNL